MEFRLDAAAVEPLEPQGIGRVAELHVQARRSVLRYLRYRSQVPGTYHLN
jgi:hypothetical protein